jgi:SnoaL-like domain
VEWETTGQFVGRSVYRGHEGVQDFLRTLGGEFEEFRAGPENIAEAGDFLVVYCRATGLGRQSRAPVEVKFSMAISLADGRITRIRHFMARRSAFEYAPGRRQGRGLTALPARRGGYLHDDLAKCNCANSGFCRWKAGGPGENSKSADVERGSSSGSRSRRLLAWPHRWDSRQSWGRA